MTIHEKHKDWLEGRGLDLTLAEKLGLTTTTDAAGKSWLSVPYVEQGRVLNHKHRQTMAKKHRMDAGAPLVLWNHDVLLSDAVRNGQTKLRAALLQCSDADTTNPQYVSPERVAHADALLEERFSILCQDFADEEHELTLEEMLELARIAVLRDGARLLILDPWNELEHKRRPDESETDYTGRSIRAIKAFAKLYDVAVWIVAHPKKPAMWGQKPAAPGLYDISGSAHWANKADYGAVIHRPDKSTNVTELVICKVRMGLPGREQTIKLEWQWTNASYVSRYGEAA